MSWEEKYKQYESKAGNQPVQDAPPAKEPKSYIFNEAKRGLLGDVFGAVADTPGRIANLGLAAYGMSEFPRIIAAATGGSPSEYRPALIESFKDPATKALLSAGGVEELKPDSGFEKLMGAGARAATGSVLSGGVGSAARETAKRALGATAAGGAAGVGAELGGEAALSSDTLKEIFGEQGAEILGKILGGLTIGAGAATTGGLPGVLHRTYKQGQAVSTNPANTAKMNAAAENIVDRTVKHAAAGSPVAETIANLDEVARLRQRFPGFNPSVAESANSPGLLDIQRKYATLNPQNLNEEAARVAASKQALVDAFNQTAKGGGKPGTIRSSVNETLASDAKRLSAKGQAVAGELPKPDLLKLGSKAEAIARAEKDAARGKFNQIYGEVFEIDKTPSIPSTPIVKSIEEALGMPMSQIKPDTLPNTFKAIQRFIGGEGGTGMQAEMNALVAPAAQKTGLTLREAVDLKRAIGADASMAARSTDPLAATRLHNIGKVGAVVDDVIAQSPIAQQAKDALKNADDLYKAEYVPRFKEGANLRMFKDSSVNEPKILPDKFIDEYFKTDQAAGGTRAAQFKQLFGANQEARDIAKTGIMDKYRNAVVDPVSGQIDIGKHAKFLQDHDRTLTQFRSNGVNALDDIKTIGTKAAKIAESQAALDKISGSLKFNTTDDLIDSALKDRKVMGNVQLRMNKDVKDTFNAQLMERAWSSGTGKGMEKFLTDNRDTLQMTLSKEHLSTLDDLAKGLAVIERAPVKGAIPGSGTDPLKASTGVSMATVWSQWRATTGGRQGAATAGFNLAAPVMTRLSQTKFDDVMKTALHDPKSAQALRDFLAAGNSQQATGFFNKLMSSLRTAGGIAWDSRGALANTVLNAKQYPKTVKMVTPAILNATKEREE